MPLSAAGSEQFEVGDHQGIWEVVRNQSRVLECLLIHPLATMGSAWQMSPSTCKTSRNSNSCPSSGNLSLSLIILPVRRLCLIPNLNLPHCDWSPWLLVLWMGDCVPCYSVWGRGGLSPARHCQQCGTWAELTSCLTAVLKSCHHLFLNDALIEIPAPNSGTSGLWILLGFSCSKVTWGCPSPQCGSGLCLIKMII